VVVVVVEAVAAAEVVAVVAVGVDVDEAGPLENPKLAAPHKLVLRLCDKIEPLRSRTSLRHRFRSQPSKFYAKPMSIVNCPSSRLPKRSPTSKSYSPIVRVSGRSSKMVYADRRNTLVYG
jgi:hypothetical protein